MHIMMASMRGKCKTFRQTCLTDEESVVHHNWGQSDASDRCCYYILFVVLFFSLLA